LKTEVRSDWGSAILVCGKCSKKAGDWPRLAKALRAALGGGKGRRATLGVVETKCLGVCPKRGVVVIDTARPKQWQVVAPGTPMTEVLARLRRDQA
jgi:predicted metal-binding protein